MVISMESAFEEDVSILRNRLAHIKVPVDMKACEREAESFGRQALKRQDIILREIEALTKENESIDRSFPKMDQYVSALKAHNEAASQKEYEKYALITKRHRPVRFELDVFLLAPDAVGAPAYGSYRVGPERLPETAEDVRSLAYFVGWGVVVPEGSHKCIALKDNKSAEGLIRGLAVQHVRRPSRIFYTEVP